MKANLLMATQKNISRQDFSCYNVELRQRHHTKARLLVRALPLTAGSVPLSIHSSFWVAEDRPSTVRPLPTGHMPPVGMHFCFLTPGLPALASVDCGSSLLPADCLPSSRRKRRYVSSSSQSSDSTKAYAGAKFTSPPSPKLLPLPPLHWRLGFGLSSCQSPDNRRCCSEMTNAIKSLLQI